MAVYDVWEMGVALPIKNHKFNVGSFGSSTLQTSVGSSATSFSFLKSGWAYKAVKRGDVITVGPSTNSSYTGLSENVVVASISEVGGYTGYATVSLRSALQYSYSATDIVRFYGNALGGGWEITTTGNSNILFPQSITGHSGDSMSGKMKDNAQFIRYDYSNADFNVNAKSYANLLYRFNSNPFIEHANYRVGMRYKSYGVNYSGAIDSQGGQEGVGAYIHVSLTDGVGWFTGATQRDIRQNSWTTLEPADLSSKRRLSRVSLDNTNSTGFLNMFVVGMSNNDKINLIVDDVYGEHAYGTTPITTTSIYMTKSKISALSVVDNSSFTVGEIVNLIDRDTNTYGVGTIESLGGTGTIYLDETMNFYQWNTSTMKYTELDIPSAEILPGATVQQANSGYYTFAEYPIRSTINIDLIENIRTNVLSNGSMNYGYPTSEDSSGDRYRIRARFSNVTETFFNKIMKFYSWQKQGYLLNLHPKYDDLPFVMTGIMKISNISKSEHWDLTRISFDFTFEEVY